MALKVGGLFAGVGGAELGLASVLDAEPAWFCEFEKAPSKILAHHWPHVPNHGDVTTVDWASVEPVDIITGGSPCQDLSHAGKRLGMKAGTRSGLWASMCDAIDIIRPRLVIWENVRGAYSAEADSALEPCAGCVGDRDDGPVLRALGRVLGDLADLGYDARWYGLRAADVGAPHGRFRVFVFATPADSESVEHWDAWTDRMKAAHGNGNGHGKSLAIEAQRLLPTPVSDNSRGLPSGGTDYASLPTAVVSLLPTPRATDGTKGGPNQRGSSGDLMLPSAVHMLPTPRATRGGSATETMNLLPTPSVADTQGGRKSRSGDRSGELLLNGIAAANQWGDYAAAIHRWEAVMGRPAPAPTEVGANGNPRLSPVFVEFLMGLPEGWTDTGDVSRNDRLKALGNGIVPQQLAAALRRDCADADPTWGRRGTVPFDYDDEPGPWVDEDGYDRTPGMDLDRVGGWL